MLPDCIAMEITAAKSALEAAGITKVEVVLTQPPRGGTACGPARVVRQRQLTPYSCQLVIAHREYLREHPCS